MRVGFSASLIRLAGPVLIEKKRVRPYDGGLG